MAERTGNKERQRRSDSRERRRSLAAKPFEAIDEAARGDEQREAGGGRGSALKQAAATAAAGAVAAGLAGAAKALLERRGDAGDAEREPTRSDAGPGQPEAAAREERSEQEIPESHQQREADDDDEEQSDEGIEDQPRSRTEPTDLRQNAEESEPEGSDQQEPPGEGEPEQSEAQSEPEQDEAQERTDGSDGRGRRGAPVNEAREVVDEARRELEALLGTEPERVSGFERSEDGWTVTIEVVDLRRVPDSTDILSSYEVTLDDDRNLVSVAQKRRYRRSQIEEE
jgi:hypothetical protein